MTDLIHGSRVFAFNTTDLAALDSSVLTNSDLHQLSSPGIKSPIGQGFLSEKKSETLFELCIEIDDDYGNAETESPKLYDFRGEQSDEGRFQDESCSVYTNRCRREEQQDRVS